MKQALITALIVTILGFAQAVFAIGPEDVPRMTKEQLKVQLGSPGVVVIDVRADHDWQDSTSKIMGAVREDPHKFGAWMDKYPREKTIVFYCK